MTDAHEEDRAEAAGKTTAAGSLRRRVGVGGFIVIAVLVLLLDVFVYYSLRDQLFSTLDSVLDARVQLAYELSRQSSLPALPANLQRAGVRAEIHPPGGEAFLTQPGATRFEMLPPGLRSDDRLVGRTISLEDGVRITVYASRDGVDATLRRVLTLLAVGTGGLLLAAAFSLGLLSRLALRPLDRIVSTARRIAQGRTDERLYVDPQDTDLSRMAAAFNEMLDALEIAVDEARRSEARSRRFLADAAHQLRTPVAAMRTSAAALIREEDPDDRDRLIDNLLRETARTSRLLEMLLRIARLDRGEQPSATPVDVGAIVEEEATRARGLAPTLTITADLDRAPDERTVLGDEVGLREAVANLLDNARRFAVSRIDVTVLADGDDVEITVEDDGPGLSPGDEERAFDRFFSLDQGGGAGLGLPIARAVLRAHGGDATYEGGRFVLRLPRGGPGDDAQRDPLRRGERPPADPSVDAEDGDGGDGLATPATTRGAARGRTPRT